MWYHGRPLSADEVVRLTAETSSEQHPTHGERLLDFDRVDKLDGNAHLATLYVDPTSPTFPVAYKEWTHKRGEVSFRLRYKPALGVSDKPLAVSGYGVELALKRTDYIVIDDREHDQRQEQAHQIADIELDDTDVQDVKPLSSSELRNLGLNAASYIMTSENPLDALVKISQDFPKYSAALSQNNATAAFLHEHRANRDILLRSGLNALWLNGQQVSPREIDAFSFIDILRRERRFINKLQKRGLTPEEAVNLVSHPAFALAQSGDDVQRYDFRDKNEGGNVIIWLNDLEKDKRYDEWPDTITAYLQRMFPGQLPSVRKNAQTVIYPVDMTDGDDVSEVVQSLQDFVKRTVPVRFGIVPIVRDQPTTAHAQVLYYLHKTYGLSAMMKYLQHSLKHKTLSQPSEKTFTAIAEVSKLKRGQKDLTMSEVNESSELAERAKNAGEYIARLGSTDPKPPIFANGVPVPRDEGWMQALSGRLSIDLRTIQQAVFEEAVDEESWLPSLFLSDASLHRDPLLVPEDDKNVTLFDLSDFLLQNLETFSGLPSMQSGSQDGQKTILLVVGDMTEKPAAELAAYSAVFTGYQDNIQVRFLHYPKHSKNETSADENSDGVALIKDILGPFPQLSFISDHLINAIKAAPNLSNSERAAYDRLASYVGLERGDRAVLLNGRCVGPLSESRTLSAEDLRILYNYEHKKRVQPTVTAVDELDLGANFAGRPFAIAQISTMLALSTISDIPEGIFDSTPGPRTNVYERWNSSSTCITIGSEKGAMLQFVAVIDPSSEIAQRWIPILKVLSELPGVYMRLFLNPREQLQELPTKRFYRHVLESAPRFDESGALTSQGAQFTGIPENALLTMTMDLPPSWLVASKESVHDLDNLRLSSLKDYSSVRATYELESILIEGHSRDMTTGSPPRGAQLVLGTEEGIEQAGTIVMANLGYFQFKANPGVYHLSLKHGNSDRIFLLDSAGTKGYAPHLGDLTTDISLTSFKGVTIFPRLSRRPGMELEDVLDTDAAATPRVIAKGAEIADDLLAKAGLPNAHAGDYIARGFKWGQDVLGMSSMTPAASMTKHADINIFSVASGHLYERMLNIMMLSVLRHTSHTVKFWFIEQFLSPSFKAFLPTLAAEYDFQYEMVTYKWPHWLRSQTEKQRTIWGYKILFLDVLFPLDLDKVIFVDADQIVRTDMYDLVEHDLEGAPYGFAPMCDSRTEMEGFRFWKQGYWSNYLRGKPYHISALYVVDLVRFRQMAAGDRLRQQYHSLSADPNSLSNLDQDLPNHMQHSLPIHSLPQEWLWCETWCSDEALAEARTIDLCNNPQTKEPKLERARRQVPEWTAYDGEIAALARRTAGNASVEGVVGVGEQERVQRSEARKKDEL